MRAMANSQGHVGRRPRIVATGFVMAAAAEDAIAYEPGDA